MKSFLDGKKTVPMAALRPPTNMISPHAPSSPSTSRPPASGSKESAASANVEVVKEGDKVVRLIVTCKCGERIEVDCLYPAGS